MKILRSLSFVSLAAFLLTACSKDEQFVEKNLTLEMESAVNNPQVPGAEYVPGEMLVKFKPGTSAAARARAFGRMNASVKEHVHTAAMKHFGDEQGVFLLKINENAFQAIEKAKAFGEVEYAEPNWVYQHQATSNDPYVTTNTTSSQLWGMYSATATAGGKANQFGIGATTAWQNNKLGSNSVYIGIIDEGYMFSHPDLTENVGVNTGEIAIDGIDDDGNGYVDDIYGWDFDGNNNTVFDGANDDHGTHVAGTIGAKGGNGIGVAGVVWQVKMLNAKFLGSRGGTTANAIKAVDYFTNLKIAGLNLVATNNSWGGGGFNQGLKDAIDRAGAAQILFVAAAGNSGTNNDASASYPSGYESSNIIAVASITSTGALSSFSQYGATTVDLGAPGSSIVSTVPARSGKVVVSSYASYSGTSMATPHVTGAAALYKSINPSATASQIKAAILFTATPTPSLNGKVLSNGRLNVSGF